jgi:hypothetical protein
MRCVEIAFKDDDFEPVMFMEVFNEFTAQGDRSAVSMPLFSQQDHLSISDCRGDMPPIVLPGERHGSRCNLCRKAQRPEQGFLCRRLGTSDKSKQGQGATDSHQFRKDRMRPICASAHVSCLPVTGLLKKPLAEVAVAAQRMEHNRIHP